MCSSHKLYAKNGSHKLTACYKAYCTYKVRKRNCSRGTMLLQATAVRGYHVFWPQVVCKKRKPHIDGSFLSELHIWSSPPWQWSGLILGYLTQTLTPPCDFLCFSKRLQSIPTSPFCRPESGESTKWAKNNQLLNSVQAKSSSASWHKVGVI